MLHHDTLALVLEKRRYYERRKKLIQNGFIEPSYRFDKYRKYLDTIFDIVVDGGYINRVIPVEKDNPNLGHKDTKEFCVFRIKGDQKANFLEM